MKWTQGRIQWAVKRNSFYLRKWYWFWRNLGVKPAGMNDCRSLTVKNGEGVLNPRDPVSANNAISEGKLLFINKKKKWSNLYVYRRIHITGAFDVCSSCCGYCLFSWWQQHLSMIKTSAGSWLPSASFIPYLHTPCGTTVSNEDVLDTVRGFEV